MSKLVHKSVYIEPEVWRRLKVNAELSDLPLRDYLRMLILTGQPTGNNEDADLQKAAGTHDSDVE
ncbi:MAG: hypothetical protein ACE37H_03615 [Phycisphaeraceae bacterium]